MKSIYKYIFSLPLGLMLFGMQSCSDDKTEDESGPRPVILKAEVFTAGNDAGATWSSGQSLGVYMLKNGSNEIIGDNANIKFLADNRGTTGYLVPANNIPIYYPTDGSKVDFRVYYPYNENIATRSLGINQTEIVLKNNTKADALLYSDNCQGATGDNKPTVQIKSMLSVVKLDMRCQIEDAATVTATIRNAATRATFDIIEGKFTERIVEDAPVLFTATKKVDNGEDVYTLQATLLSGIMEEDAVIDITVKDKAGKVLKAYKPASLRKVLALSEEQPAEENTQYDIDVQLNAASNNITTQVAAKSQIVILKWNGNDDNAIGGVARPERK